MATYRPRLFSNVGRLKAISRTNLVSLLEPWSPYLAARKIDLHANEFPYDALAEVLMRLDEKAPTKLIDALYFIDECSHIKHFEPLLAEAREDGIEIENVSTLTPADLAVQIWLKEPELLEDWHARSFAFNQRSFVYFASKRREWPMWTQPTEGQILQIQARLNESFEKRGRGQGSKIFFFPREEKIWIVIRHGMPIHREGAHKDDGSSEPAVYRPQKHDVLIYDGAVGEVGVHADTKTDRTLYCNILSFLLFGRDGFFADDAKYTLDPLVDLGPAALLCGDIEGIREVKLVKLYLSFGGPRGRKETISSDDIFADFGANWPTEIRRGRLTAAEFKIWLENGSSKGRRASIRLPNKAAYERDEDSALFEALFAARQFIRPKSPEAGVESGPILDVA